MASTSTQSSHPSDDYSSLKHRLIVFINGLAIGLLQVLYQFLTSPNSTDRRATILSYCIFIMVYAVLRVFEDKLKRNQDPIHHFVGRVSHLFGALAALVLTSIVCPIFTLIVAPLLLAWFFHVMYVFVAKLIWVPEDAGPDQISQVL